VRSVPTPLSPLLSNILLDKLDKYVESVLIPNYTKGTKRATNREYSQLMDKARYAIKHGQIERGKEMRRQAQKMPSQDLYDPEYRRLKYVR
jgi:retron-type reverse transcriptase